MSKFRFPNPDNNPYLNEYNSMVDKYETTEWKKGETSWHHILPRSQYPEFKSNEDNWLYLPVMEHIHMHYLLWKYNWIYCAAYWFCYVYFHKNYGYSITDEEYEQLKKDMSRYRRRNKDAV